jgi:class 3 adenylate cyclase
MRFKAAVGVSIGGRKVSGFLKSLAKLRNSFFLVIILIQVLLVVMSIMFTSLAINILQKDEEEKTAAITAYVNTELQQASNRALIATTAVINDGNIISVFKERNREKLFATCAKLWDSLKPLGFRQLQFDVVSPDHSDDVVFLRQHDPEKFNDSVSNRPTVVKCFGTGKVVCGLEQGTSGYSFRSVGPVMDGEKLIGVVELGFDFAEAFLEVLNANYPGDWGIYNLNRGLKSVDDRILINAIGTHAGQFFRNILPEEGILEKIKNGEIYYKKDYSTKTVSLYMPVTNFAGDIVAIIKHVYPTAFYDRIRQIIITSVIICLIGLTISGVIIFILYRMITVPVRGLITETEKIKNFQLDDQINIRSSLTDIADLVEATKSMKIGLQSFRKYVPAQLVRQLIQAKHEARISGQRKNITVFFSDIADFTQTTENTTPNELAAELSEYFSAMTEVIIEHNGTVDKYIGDSIMAFWGAPVPMNDHAVQACLAALKCQERLKELAVKWQTEGRRMFKTRIGINTGDIIVGNIGSEQRLNYTVIGDAVNVASRLERLNKDYGTGIIVSESTVEQLPADFAIRVLDFVVVKGKTEPVTIYELVAEKGDISAVDLDFLKTFNQAIDLYKNRQWEEAAKRLKRLLIKKPADTACKIYIERAESFLANPPDRDWNGEHIFHTK